MKRSRNKDRQRARQQKAEEAARLERAEQRAREKEERHLNYVENATQKILDIEKKIAAIKEERDRLTYEDERSFKKKQADLIEQNRLLLEAINIRKQLLDSSQELEMSQERLNKAEYIREKYNKMNRDYVSELESHLNKYGDMYEKMDFSGQSNLAQLEKTFSVSTDLRATGGEYMTPIDELQALPPLLNQLMESSKNVGTENFFATDFSEIIRDLKLTQEIFRDQTGEQMESLDATIQVVNAYQNLANQLNRVNTATGIYRNTINGMGAAFQAATPAMTKFIQQNLPGGKILSNLFNFKNIGQNFRQNLSNNFNNVLMSRVQQNPAQMPGFASTLMQALGQTIRAMGVRLLAFAGAGFLAVMMYFMNRFDKLISKIVKDMGITRSEAAGLARDTQVMSRELGASSVYAEQLLESANKIREGLGGIDIAARIRSGNLTARELVKTGAVLSDKFDMSGEEIGGLALTGIMFNKTLTQTTNIATNMAKGVRSVKDTLKDVANIPAKISAGFSGNIAQLIAMVNKAKLLGTSVESIRNMSENLLEIETSVAKQFEAQVLTGRQMDFDKARYYSLMGRDDLAFQETLSQVGSLKQFKQFTPIAQKSIAEAAGFDVEEMSRILGRQELIQKLGISKEEFDSMLQRGENITALIEKRKQDGLVSEEDYNELRKLSEEYDSTTILEKLKRMAITLGNALSLLFEPFVEYLRQFMANGGDQVIRSLGQSLASMAKAVLSIATALGPIGTMGFMGAVAGGVIGSFFGGPYGALIGMGIGGALGLTAGAIGGANAPSGYGADVINQTPPAVISDQTRGYDAYSAQNSDANKHLADISNSLKSIDQQTKTPARITIGDKSISEIGNVLSLTKNYVTGLDNVYNTVQSSNYRA